MNLTYRQLQEEISKMTEEQKDCNVSVYVAGFDEFCPVDEVSYSVEDDVLNEGHPIINTVEIA